MPFSLLDDLLPATAQPTSLPSVDTEDLFRLSGSVGAQADNDRQDVIKTQLMLDRAGHLDLGSLGGPTGWPGGELTRGLRSYQKARGLGVDGLMLPDGETLRSLSDDLADMAGTRVPTPQEVDRQHQQWAQAGMQEHAAPVRGETKGYALSEQGLHAIRQHETLQQKTYRDQAGHNTIGYGHKLLPGEEKLYAGPIDEKTATALLAKDVAAAEAAVKRLVKSPLSQQEYDALVSLAYNIGQGGFADSTTLKQLNKGDYKAAADAMLMWDKITQNGQKVQSNGLVTRRNTERNLFLNGTYQSGADKK
ncbi:glycoside hydrolase family protein [Ferrovibrio terrae]|uniref:glycoside hydrolase family protein n=1 Tax=Ferrovibrio terrae TaxID=2594003 RepID=UPI0031377CBE